MPYRRLPNTDSARLRALKVAYKMGFGTHPNDLAFSQKTYTRLGLFINTFEQACVEYQQAYQQQSNSSEEYKALSRKARLYVSHFLQVLNMAILRGELSPSMRTYFGMDEDTSKLPSLSSDKDLIKWGKCTIEGENQRKCEAHTPIMNPTIALVQVHYDNFVEAYTRQCVFQKNSARTLKKLIQLRVTADEIIRDIWNEVEATYEALPDTARREQAQRYGVQYVYRKNETKENLIADRLFGSDDSSQLREYADLLSLRKNDSEK